MKIIITIICIAVYILVLFYLLMGTLGYGLRLGGNVYAEEGFGSLRITHLVLLVLLICVGIYFLLRIARHSI